MKIAFQNFISTLKRYKTASVLNIAGLTIAFIAFYILMAQVYYGFTYNSSIPDNERIYLVTTTDEKEGPCRGLAPRPTTQKVMQECSDVELWGFTFFSNRDERVWSKKDDVFTPYQIDVDKMTPSIIDISSMKLLQGTKEDFLKPNVLFISASTAKKMDVKLGEDIYLQHEEFWNGIRPGKGYMVAGIFEDFAPNSTFGQMKIVRKIADDEYMSDGYYIFEGFVKLYPNTTTEKFEQMWYDAMYPMEEEDGQMVRLIKGSQNAKLRSLKELYFAPRLEHSLSISQGDKREHITQFAIALMIIVIAFINFINFFMALIPRRLRTVNISKVFGATNFTLRWNFLFEALALTVVSLALALYLMIAIQDSFIADYVDCSLALKDNLHTIALILLGGVIIAIIAAAYPAWYITSFEPSLAVKGGFAGSVSGRRLRMVLIGVQFTISLVLIITTLAFFVQYRHLTKYDLGFKTDNIVQVMITDVSFRNKRSGERFITALESSANVVDVTAKSGDFFSSGMSERIMIDSENSIPVEVRDVRHNFFQFFGIPVNFGRDFTPGDSGKEHIHIYNKVGFDYQQKQNEYYAKEKIIIAYRNEPKLIGVLDDKLLVTPLNEEQKPIQYRCADTFDLFTFYIRLHPSVDVAQFSEFVRQKIEEFEVDAEKYEISMFEDTIAELYSHTRKQTVLLALFSVLSIVISLMGVFGIIIFETQFRRKEIAIRRVFGSTTSGLLWMFNSRYGEIVMACFLLSVPVAYYIIQEWQKDFAHKAHIGWWIYLSALAMVMLLTLALVTYRSLKAARENPADVVKGE
ncbi:MAG: ABC transporter permease [Alistipes sp.]|nr:ABC transporter permease [Alistipes sp.]